MLFLFGTGTTVTATEALPGLACQYCHTTGNLAVSVVARYAQLFFIPVLPLGKTSVTVCGHCRQTLRTGEQPAAYLAPVAAVVARAKTPLWHFAVLGVFGALFAIALLSAVVERIRTIGDPDPAVPVVGQRFRMNLGDTSPDAPTPGPEGYMLAEIERVTPDSVYYRTTGQLRGPLTPATATVALRDSLAPGAAHARYPVAMWHFLTTGEGRMRLYN